MKTSCFVGSHDFPPKFHGISTENGWNYFHSTKALVREWNGKPGKPLPPAAREATKRRRSRPLPHWPPATASPALPAQCPKAPGIYPVNTHPIIQFPNNSRKVPDSKASLIITPRPDNPSLMARTDGPKPHRPGLTAPASPPRPHRPSPTAPASRPSPTAPGLTTPAPPPPASWPLSHRPPPRPRPAATASPVLPAQCPKPPGIYPVNTQPIIQFPNNSRKMPDSKASLIIIPDGLPLIMKSGPRPHGLTASRPTAPPPPRPHGLNGPRPSNLVITANVSLAVFALPVALTLLTYAHGQKIPCR